MSSTASNNKYQVYFFLYLAVICELLIIIVERDDAEQGWMREQARLKRALADMIENLSSTVPVSVIRGATEMAVGETRSFTFTVSGLGARDEVTVAPTIVISKNGSFVDSLTQPGAIVDSVHRNAHGERVYRFAWRAPSVGQYEFRSLTGTNFIDHVNADSVKIGPLVIARRVFEEVTGKRPEELASENIRNSMLVNVVSTAEPLGVHAGNLATTAGYPVSQRIEVEGTTPERVQAVPSVGRVVRSGRDLVWEHTFEEAGEYSVRLSAADNRGEGGKSHALAAFTVSVKESALPKPPPEKVFAHETFRFGIAVPGLNEVTQYRWTVLSDGRELRSGTGATVEFKPLSTGKLTVRATYAGREYPVGRGASVFPVQVLEPPARIYDESFAANGEYPLQHKFEFRAARFGKRPSEFSIPIPGSDIRIEVEDEDGRDLLDAVDVMTASDHTVVAFRLKGALRGDVTAVTVTIRLGTQVERIPLRLYREDGALRP